MSKRILIVDDEADLADLLAYNLHRAGYTTQVAHDGRAALDAVPDFRPDLLVLDLMMPELSGLDVAERLKRDPATRALPVIMLTARAEETDQLQGFAAGADDYVTKPFTMRVLEARIEAVLRRAAAVADNPAQPASARRVFGPLALDPETHEVTLNNEPVRLTVTEFRLLESLMNADGRVLSRQALIMAALGPGVTVTERTIDVHITSIRKKLASSGDLVRTVRGVGYRLQPSARSLAGGSNQPREA